MGRAVESEIVVKDSNVTWSLLKKLPDGNEALIIFNSDCNVFTLRILDVNERDPIKEIRMRLDDSELFDTLYYSITNEGNYLNGHNRIGF